MVRALRPAVAAALTSLALAAHVAAGPEPAGSPGAPARRASSTCVEDDQVPTPPDYLGWDRSSLVAWEAVEQYGGIVPEIEEDRSHAPPAWWRYPSALRSAELLAAEARDPKGLYARVDADDLKPGDLLVRAVGAGACGKMALIAGKLHDQMMTVEADGDGTATRSASATFFGDANKLRPEVAAYRVRVKKDDTLGHARELRRDLDHLERTIAERPPLIAKNGRQAVDEKLHDLVDEAWSLVADPAFDLERRALGGRALALGAALDWPGAAAAATAVLDDVLRRDPGRKDAALARASVALLAGQADKAADAAGALAATPGAPPRARYVEGRALLAVGKSPEGLAALRRYLEDDPADPRAKRLVATGGREPRLDPAPPADATLVYTATADATAVGSTPYGLRAEWPVTWRVLGQSITPEDGLLIELLTGRVLLPSGEAERGVVTILAQRPKTPAARRELVKKGARSIFPDTTVTVKSLPPLVRGTRREQFRERKQGRMGEVTTFDGASVAFLVLNAPAGAYAKLKDEYATFVKSVRPGTAE